MVGSEPIALPDSVLLTDRSGPVPLYYQIASGIEQSIHSGALPPGSRLENEIAMSERLGLSRPTVRRAIQELVERGLLVRRRGIGTQVLHGAITRRVELTSLYDDLDKSGQTPTTVVLAVERIPAGPVVGERLSVDESDTVVRLRRLRSASGAPLAILENYLPSSFLDLADEDFATHGLYQLLRTRGVTLRVARQRIGARKSTAEESRLLSTERAAPVLTMDRTAYDADGRAAEYGHHCYRPDLYSFEMTLVDR